MTDGGYIFPDPFPTPFEEEEEEEVIFDPEITPEPEPEPEPDPPVPGRKITYDDVPQEAFDKRREQRERMEKALEPEWMDALRSLGSEQANVWADGSASGRGLEAIAGIDAEQKKLNRWIMGQLAKARPQSRQWYTLHQMMEETNETFDQQKKLIREDMEKGSGRAAPSMWDIIERQRELESYAPGLAEQLREDAGVPAEWFEEPEEPEKKDAVEDSSYRRYVYNTLKDTYDLELRESPILTPAIMANAEITSAMVLYLETGNFQPVVGEIRTHMNYLEKAVADGLAPVGVTAANIPAIRRALDSWLAANIIRANQLANTWYVDASTAGAS